MGEIFVPVDDDLFATLSIGTPDFPFARFHDNLNQFSRGFVNWHKQLTIELSYVVEGAVKVCILNDEFLVKAGECFLILPNAFHSVLSVENQAGKYETIIFDPALLTGFSRSFFEKELYQPVLEASRQIYTFSATSNPALTALLQELFNGQTPETAAQKLKAQQALQQLWLLLHETVFDFNTTETAPLQNRRITEMIDFLRKNYQEKFSLDELAAALNISRGECCRHFKKCMRMTISEYLLEYRIGKACELLTQSDQKITEIAHAVGFESASNISMHFQKKIGMTPSAYRQSVR